MKIEMNEKAQVILTSANPNERDYLIKKYELFQNRNAITVSPEMTEQPRRKYKKNKINYMQLCNVKGCNIKAKGLVGIRAHQRTHHGIDKDGNVSATFESPMRGTTKVPSPVIPNGDGTFTLKKSGLFK
jgi:hypothetical protein